MTGGYPVEKAEGSLTLGAANTWVSARVNWQPAMKSSGVLSNYTLRLDTTGSATAKTVDIVFFHVRSAGGGGPAPTSADVDALADELLVWRESGISLSPSATAGHKKNLMLDEMGADWCCSNTISSQTNLYMAIRPTASATNHVVKYVAYSRTA